MIFFWSRLMLMSVLSGKLSSCLSTSICIQVCFLQKGLVTSACSVIFKVIDMYPDIKPLVFSKYIDNVTYLRPFSFDDWLFKKKYLKKSCIPTFNALLTSQDLHMFIKQNRYWRQAGYEDIF